MLQHHAEASLCTLSKAVTSESGEVALTPIARSYGNYPWEQAAGEYAASLFRDEKIMCYTNGCQIKLPPLVENGAEYYLSSFSYSLSETNEYARFLETATFGTTDEQLDAFESSPNSVEVDITTWISNHMNASIVPITSHREFWRKGQNGRVSMFMSYMCRRVVFVLFLYNFYHGITADHFRIFIFIPFDFISNVHVPFIKINPQ